jgi:NAD(P)H-dependent FMN reductase
MSRTIHVLAVCGSLRSGSSNGALLEAAARMAPPAMHFVFYDGLRTLPHFDPDLDGEDMEPPGQVTHLRRHVSAADALIICSPEYAHGVPGSLKNALDWLVSYPDFVGKPVLLWNASAVGGDHAQASLVETLTTMSARVLLDASLTEPFLRKKLGSGAEPEEEAARAVRSSLAALAVALM